MRPVRRRTTLAPRANKPNTSPYAVVLRDFHGYRSETAAIREKMSRNPGRIGMLAVGLALVVGVITPS